MRLLLLLGVLLAFGDGARAQGAAPCLAPEGPVDPARVWADYALTARAPLADVLDRVARCEVTGGAVATALLRARLSDDPALRPVLRRVADATRGEGAVTAASAYLALAVLGEDPDALVDAVERAVSEGHGPLARRVASISAAFPDSARHARLRALETASGVPLVGDDYWAFQTVFEDPAQALREEVAAVGVAGAVSALVTGFSETGARLHGGSERGLPVSAWNGDAFQPHSVWLVLGGRRLGAAYPDAVRAAAAESEPPSPPYSPAPSEAFAEVFRRVALSLALPGESLTSDAPAPPADGSLFAEVLPAAVLGEGALAAEFRGAAFSVSGRPHSADGEPTDGPPALAVATTTPGALAGALSGGQADRVEGGIEAAPLPVRPDAWAGALAARADVVLADRARGDVGAPDAPVVAYAPAGTRLDGDTRGWGVLVVDGALELRGRSRWTGIVLVRDGAEGARLAVSGSGAVVGAAVLADGAALDLRGDASVLYSPEALALARSAALRVD